MSDPKQTTPTPTDTNSEALVGIPDSTPGKRRTSITVHEDTSTGRTLTILGARMPAKSNPSSDDSNKPQPMTAAEFNAWSDRVFEAMLKNLQRPLAFE